jgi:hypothetical protein
MLVSQALKKHVYLITEIFIHFRYIVLHGYPECHHIFAALNNAAMADSAERNELRRINMSNIFDTVGND